jgi:hypothetical protein
MNTGPPTVADLKAQGVPGATVWCIECHRRADKTFDELRAPDDMQFPEIVKTRRLRCSCGSDRVSLMPNWPPKGPGGLAIAKP